MDWSWVFRIILTVLGLFNLYLIITRTRKLKAKRAWPETVGIISQGRIEEDIDYKGNTSRFAVFTFIYNVSGFELYGRFLIGRLGVLSLSKAEKVIAEHLEGSSIPVRYNPEAPQEYFTKFDDDDFSNYVMRLWLYFMLLMIPFSCSLAGLFQGFIK